MSERNALILTLVTTCFLSNCGMVKTGRSLGSVEDGQVVDRDLEHAVANNSDTVIDDRFVREVLANDLSTSILRRRMQLVNIEAQANRHDSSVQDSLAVYSDGEDTAVIYISQTKALLQSLSLRSNKTALNDSIRVGIVESLMKHRFDLGGKDALGLLLVKDLENSSHFRFEFHKGYLKRIEYETRYLD